MDRKGTNKKALTDAQQKEMDIRDHEEEIFYSSRYADEQYEYRHVALPKQIAKWIPQKGGENLLTEQEWRGLGIKQSLGWVHHMTHKPEPHILVFRRDLPAKSESQQSIETQQAEAVRAN
ncbi:cyclin-dependent kinase regulatory subunit CKS1 [Hyaloraphidium curvatum]|nr:cyclin-dependent kinase regulatory subunit CKS1 [Hyaloraphidium curvatum]